MPDRQPNQNYSGYLDSITKRSFDIAASVLLLGPAIVLLAWAITYCLIRKQRSLFFIQQRVGKHGKIFRMPKLRTLQDHDAPPGSSPKPGSSLVLTPAGKFLRRHRLDELPQLFSVLTGQMSLVGPRPELPRIVATYDERHKKRLAAKPGITGLWQILGDRNRRIHENMMYDLYYLRNASLRLDIKILFMTIPFILDPGPETNAHETRIHTHELPLSK